MADNNEADFDPKFWENPANFVLNYNGVLYRVAEKCDEGLVEYLITSDDKKIASLFLQDGDYSFNMHTDNSAGADLLNAVYEEIKVKKAHASINTDELQLTASEFYRLNFSEGDDNHWCDIDAKLKLAMNDDGTYTQYLLDKDDEQLFFGIPLKTVGDLQRRYLSVTGHQLKRWNEDHPQTGQ